MGFCPSIAALPVMLTEAMRDAAVARLQKLLNLIQAFVGTQSCAAWKEKKDCVQLTQFLDDLAKLDAMVAAVTSSDVKLTSERVDGLKAARNQLLQKKSSFAESLTLFPLGQYLQQTVSVRVEGFLKDQALKTDLGQCMQLASSMKTFSSDGLFKGDSLDIVIPSQAKVIELVQKLAIVQQVGSSQFMAENETELRLANLKIIELQSALLNACVHKFRRMFVDTLKPLLKALSEGKLETDATAKLIEVVNQVKEFAPVQTAVLNKCLGSAAAPIIEALQQARLFWTRFATIISAVVGLMDAESVQCVVGRLLKSDILDLVQMYNNHSKMEQVQKLCMDLWPEILKIGDNMRRSAMPPNGTRAQHVTGFGRALY